MMRRIEYKVEQCGEPFTVSSYDFGNSDIATTGYLPIKMSITRCAGDSGEMNPIHGASLNTIIDEDFALHYVDILLGKSSDWRLVQFQVSAEYINLEYYCPSTAKFENIKLSIHESPINILNITFTVPHQSGCLATEYRIFMDYGIPVRGAQPCSSTMVTEYLPTGSRNIFMFTSDNPDEISVSEYVDL